MNVLNVGKCVPTCVTCHHHKEVQISTGIRYAPSVRVMSLSQSLSMKQQSDADNLSMP